LVNRFFAKRFSVICAFVIAMSVAQFPVLRVRR
jgi:hypothetical protein